MEEPKILVVLAATPKDKHLALNVLRWMAEMGQEKTHPLMLSTSGLSTQDVDELIRLGGEVFTQVEEISFPNESAHMPWPIPHNQQFARTARVLGMRRKKPIDPNWVGQGKTHFFWFEADATPLVPNWLEIFESELQLARAKEKWFVGDYVQVPRDDPRTGNTPDHLSGVSIYPILLSHFSITAMTSVHAAWDVASAGEILPQAYITPAIHHVYWEPTFKNRDDLRSIRSNAVLFHQCKDASLIDVLRRQRGLDNLREDSPQLVKATPRRRRLKVPPAKASAIYHDWVVEKMTHAEVTAKHEVSRYVTKKIVNNPEEYGVKV